MAPYQNVSCSISIKKSAIKCFKTLTKFTCQYIYAFKMYHSHHYRSKSLMTSFCATASHRVHVFEVNITTLAYAQHSPRLTSCLTGYYVNAHKQSYTSKVTSEFKSTEVSTLLR